MREATAYFAVGESMSTQPCDALVPSPILLGVVKKGDSIGHLVRIYLSAVDGIYPVNMSKMRTQHSISVLFAIDPPVQVDKVDWNVYFAAVPSSQDEYDKYDNNHATQSCAIGYAHSIYCASQKKNMTRKSQRSHLRRIPVVSWAVDSVERSSTAHCK